MDQFKFNMLKASKWKVMKENSLQFTFVSVTLLMKSRMNIACHIHASRFSVRSHGYIKNIQNITYKCLNGTAPAYLQELIKRYIPSRTLRSSSQSRLTCSVTSTQYGHRAFSVSSTELWNSLPIHIKNSESQTQFKTLLKTHLFTIAFQ